MYYDDDDQRQELFVGNISLCHNVANKVFLPYVGDCNKYYLCWNGEAVMRQCEWPFYFDARTQSCVKEKDQCLPMCQNYNLTTFAYARTCSKYVLCYFGTPVLRECPDGLQYNSETDRCDFPEIVDCVDSQCSIYSNAYQLHFVASKKACDTYFICGNGIPKELTCAPGLYFSEKCLCCDLPKYSDCNITALDRKKPLPPLKRSSLERSELSCPPHGIHFYPHQTLQDSYYYCVHGHGLILNCTPGLVYDPTIQECRESQNLGIQNW
ncbi:uncharacterized protein Dwil_GK17093 [Drosophila willistoni]|uniref:Chitin-binding type-2 domain-containing protein n=1 Tax=Drosophila willistoni TaxID=7260 RepID=B4MNA3_DROWI|nr:uncharacterized protein Dwil_GK17093 [Drosophila willistoni]